MKKIQPVFFSSHPLAGWLCFLGLVLITLTACITTTPAGLSAQLTASSVTLVPQASFTATYVLPTPEPAAPTQTSSPSPTLPPTGTLTPSATPLPSVTATPASIRFAVIGDYGEGSQGEADVAALVKSWSPDFIITTGDNNYPIGSAETIDEHIGQYYQEYIYPYAGAFGPGADRNRFFPTLGNHDWDTPGAQPYLDYFSLPNNERYYDFIWGPVHFFAINSDSREPDGVGYGTLQGQWFQSALAASSTPWQIVYMHHPPYSSGYHGPVNWMEWPFAAWGADAALFGHDHVYERLSIDGIPYFINGVGGGPIYPFLLPDENSQFRYNDDYGAMLVVADAGQITFQFINRQGVVIDTFQIGK